MKDLNQELAVEFEHRDIIVAAGAGTGKTESMTNRVVRNVLRGTGIRRILVLTFTNLAAAEMKGRIESKLRKAAYEMRDPEEKKRLLDEAQQVDRAHIRTFHSFCVELIREYHHYLEIGSDFHVLSDAERSLLLKEVFEEVFREVREENPSFSSFYAWYSLMDKAGKPDTLAGHVRKVFEAAENAPNFEEKLHDLSAYTPEKIEFWERENRRLIPKYERAVLQKLEVFEKFVAQSPVGGRSDLETDGAMLVVYNEKGVRKEISSPRAVSAINLDKARARLAAVLRGEDEAYRRTSLDKKIPDEVYSGLEIFGNEVESREEYAKIATKVHEDVKKAIDALKKRMNFGKDPHRELFADAFEVFSDFVLRIKTRFDRAKAERNALDFGDQEHRALELLSMEDVRASVRAKFDHVFVDENQDSSEVQDRIVGFVSGDSLYRVGDVKQCIYAFRNADPKIFQRYIEHDALFYDAYAPEKPDEAALASAPRVVIPLNTNFRTTQPILDFVNRIFGEEMKDLYKDADLISFRTVEARMKAAAEGSQNGVQKEPQKRSQKDPRDESQKPAPEEPRDESSEIPFDPVRVLCYRRDPEILEEIATGKGVDPKDLPDVAHIEIEAEIVAREIKRMVEEKGCRYRDFAVLLRNLTHRGNAFRRAFSRHHIPLETQSEGDMLDSYEIAVLTSALRAVLNPYRDADFVNLLLSPFFEFSLEDLQQLSRAIKSQDDEYYSLFRRIRFTKEAGYADPDSSASSESSSVSSESSSSRPVSSESASLFGEGKDFAYFVEEILPEALVEKVLFAYEKVNWLRGYSHYLTPSEFIWKLYDFNDFFDKIGNLPDGARRQENLKIYLATVGEEGGSLDEIAHREHIKVPNSISEDSDAVKLMTMHSSKGMGFPHVFLCDLGGKIYKKDRKAKMIVTDAGVAIKSLRNEGVLIESEIFEVAEEYNRVLALEEEKRILYVAMTRAKVSLTILNRDGETVEDEDVDVEDPAELKFEEKEVHFDVIRPYIDGYVIPYDAREIESLLYSPGYFFGSSGVNSRDDERAEAPEPVESPVRSERPGHSEMPGHSETPGSSETLGRSETPGSSESPEDSESPGSVEVSGSAGRCLTSAEERQLQFRSERVLADANLATARTANFAEKNRALEMGTEAHRELEHFDFKRLLTMTEEELRETGFSEHKSVDRFLKSSFARRIAEADEVYKEASFVDDTGSGKTQGIIDLFFIEKGRIVLVDYKTDVYKNEDEMKEIVARYEPQLKRYRDVLERVYEREVAEVYLYLLHGEGRPVMMKFGGNTG